MVYLVTGGAGFIGSHLCARLLREGRRVLAVDNFSTGSYANIAGLAAHPGFSLVTGDVRDQELMAKLVREADVIFHLAAAVGVRHILHHPVETLETNILGTHVLLSLAARYQRLILVASTSEVYGKSRRERFSEEDDLVLGPSHLSRWGYACSKLADEFLALAYHRERRLPVIITRLFNTVGPRQTGRYGMVLPTFVAQALRGEPITVHGSGRQTRCFIHVAEVVEVLIQLTGEPRAVGEIFNIGSTEEVSIAHLAQVVKEITRSSSPIVFLPYEQVYGAGYEDMDHRVPDISKIQSLLGFSPRRRLSLIVREVADWLREDAAAVASFGRRPAAD
ncbi:MAG: GDP-mannose 4,6-dehydratase [Syntrophobacterales bacterium]|nr:GDP-mannose 4,6-dehydratase [Syntrophobacterales bacterium]